MRDRLLGVSLFTAVVVSITSCGATPSLTSIVVAPSTVTATPTFGLQNQFTAIGYYTRPAHTPVTRDITNEVTWSSGTPQMVTIDSTGLATVTGAVVGNTTITASSQGFHGIVQGTATFNVQQASTSGGVTRLGIVSQLRESPRAGSTVQFNVVGTTGKGGTAELAGNTVWTSTDSEVATIDKSTGKLTAIGAGRTTISAVYTNPDGTTAVAVTHLFVAPAAERE